jgi:hypothetical protein
LYGGSPVKKILSALLALIAIFMAYAFAAFSISVPEGGDTSLGARLKLPFDKPGGIAVGALIVGLIALLGALYLMFSRSRSQKAARMSSTKVAARYAMIGRKSKGLEIGFLFSGVLALVVLAVIVFGTIKLWFDKEIEQAVLGVLGSVFILQILMGLIFFILFLKKKDKAIIPFIPAMALFLFEVAIGAFGLVKGLT